MGTTIMQIRPKWCLFLSCLALLGCESSSTGTADPVMPPTGQAMQYATGVSSAGEELPQFEDVSEVPADWTPVVKYVGAEVNWEGSVAAAAGRTAWYGNQGVMTLKLNVLSGTTNVGGDSFTYPTKSVFPGDYSYYQTMSYGVSEGCGHVANFTTHQTAAIVVLIKSAVTTIGETSGSNSATSRQPSCPKQDDPNEECVNLEQCGDGGGEGGGGGGGGGDGTVTCKTTTYEVQERDGTSWVHIRYEYETVCYY